MNGIRGLGLSPQASTSFLKMGRINSVQQQHTKLESFSPLKRKITLLKGLLVESVESKSSVSKRKITMA